MKANYAGLALDSADVSTIGNAPRCGRRSSASCGRADAPAGRPRPDAPAQDGLVAWLETELDRAAAAAPNPGRTEPFHRVNRAEYRNVIRGPARARYRRRVAAAHRRRELRIRYIAGVLKINQSQMEQFLAAARKVSRTALAASGSTTGRAGVPRAGDAAAVRARGWPASRNARRHAGPLRVPSEREYEIAVELLCRIQASAMAASAFPDEHRMEVAVDGSRVQLFTLEPRKEFRPPAERMWRVRAVAEAGPHDVAVAFLKLPSIREVDARMERFLRPNYLTGVVGEPSQTIYMPYVDRVTITGPLGTAARGVSSEEHAQTPSRQRILTCRPATVAEEVPCARKILTPLTRRAYRRPVTDADLAPLLRFYRDGRAQGGFDAGVEAALQRLLISPEFLFRIERDPSPTNPDANYRISDLELARASHFFSGAAFPTINCWMSPPAAPCTSRRSSNVKAGGCWRIPARRLW